MSRFSIEIHDLIILCSELGIMKVWQRLFIFRPSKSLLQNCLQVSCTNPIICKLLSKCCPSKCVWYLLLLQWPTSCIYVNCIVFLCISLYAILVSLRQIGCKTIETVDCPAHCPVYIVHTGYTVESDSIDNDNVSMNIMES